MKLPAVDREYVEIYPLNWKWLSESSAKSIFRAVSFMGLPEVSVYIHIPFCPKICPFCTFYKRMFDKDLYHMYIEAVKKEIAMFAEHPDFSGRRVTALYFGGGTGSMLFPEDLGEIMEKLYESFPLDEEAEITMECYPTTLDRGKLLEYRDIGVNRISIGVQSFSRRNLQSIGREDTYYVNRKVVALAKEIGFEKVTIDLMYRFPQQTIDDLLEDLEALVALQPDGVSTYSLEISDTPLEKVGIPSDDIDREMFYLIGEFLERQGYRRFAQPDFARPGKESRYVLNAWRAPQQLLLGLGPGAHTHYFGGHIWANVYSVEKYIKAMNSGIFAGIVGSSVSVKELMHKYMVLGVRCVEIEKASFKRLFGVDVERYFAAQLRALTELGWLRETREKFIVTKQGLWYIDNISKMFYSELNARERQPWGKNLQSLSRSFL